MRRYHRTGTASTRPNHEVRRAGLIELTRLPRQTGHRPARRALGAAPTSAHPRRATPGPGTARGRARGNAARRGVDGAPGCASPPYPLSVGSRTRPVVDRRRRPRRSGPRSARSARCGPHGGSARTRGGGGGDRSGRQALTAPAATSRDDRSPGLGAHAATESVLAGAAAGVRLVRALHRSSSSGIVLRLAHGHGAGFDGDVTGRRDGTTRSDDVRDRPGARYDAWNQPTTLEGSRRIRQSACRPTVPTSRTDVRVHGPAQRCYGARFRRQGNDSGAAPRAADACRPPLSTQLWRSLWRTLPGPTSTTVAAATSEKTWGGQRP